MPPAPAQPLHALGLLSATVLLEQGVGYGFGLFTIHRPLLHVRTSPAYSR
jgi:hypothetical protein